MNRVSSIPTSLTVFLALLLARPASAQSAAPAKKKTKTTLVPDVPADEAAKIIAAR
jgi:hypothetical protein